MANAKIPITSDADANRLLEEDPLALIIGMLLDQQVPMEWAFIAPFKLKDRLGGTLDAAAMARMDPDEFIALFKGPPALHRFPGSMGKRVQSLTQAIVDDYGGDTSRIWREAETGDELKRRLLALPGFGPDKTRIFIALLAKRLNIRPSGWEQAAGPFADDTPRSVADIDSAETLARVREWKQAMKKQGKTKSD
jgi:uncharacterized HhH-GPD family protein